MIRCFILDDEQHAINSLQKYVDQTPFLRLIGTATNGLDALDLLNSDSIDLLFLDIQMPGISGLDLLKIIKVPVILTTAYSEYALDGFEHDVIDYLLKPITYPRFLKAAQKAATMLKNSSLLPESHAKPAKDYLFIKGENKGKQVKINFNEIEYIESAKNYVIFHSRSAKHIATMNLKDVELLLPISQFVRIHNSFIVSIAKVSAIEGNQVIINKYDQDTVIKLAIGATYKSRLMELIG